MTLSEIYDLAKMTPDYPEFEHLVKCELTGLPYTQVIDFDVHISLIKKDPPTIYLVKTKCKACFGSGWIDEDGDCAPEICTVCYGEGYY